MARRMTNKERIERMALESAAAAEEKKEKKEKKETKVKVVKKKAARTSKKKVASSGRRKMIWKVFDSGFREVATFAYPEKEKAEAEAGRLTEASGKNHFVNPASVPLDE